MPDDNEDPKLRWDESKREAWKTTVEGWPWQELGGGSWAKNGACERCGDGISITKAGAQVYALIEPVEPDLDLMEKAEEGPVQVLDEGDGLFYARCNCSGEHPGRPARLKTGCGAWAYIAPPARSAQ